MSGKGSRLSRLIEYFKAADLEEAKYVFARAADILSERQIPQTIQRKLALGKRKRRTKAQMAAEKAVGASLGKAVTHLENAAQASAVAAGE